MTSFTEQALVFIISALVLVPLFQKLGFGSILGYIVAGVLVGPYGFKLIEDSESVLHFSEWGVVFLLFIIGLEINPRKLWSMRKHLFGLGGTQIIFCSAIFAGVLALCGLPFIAAITLGFSFSLSSTAFAVQALTEKNLFNTEFGRASFSVLLMQDLVAIPALAIIPALASNVPNAKSVNVWLALGLIVALVVASRLLIRPLFRFVAGLRSREVFVAVTLLIVLGVAELMQKVGLSAALGTFIAGVLLAESEYRHELEINIEPFKGLLMGLFFIAVGMGVSLDLIAAKPFFIFGLTLAYLITKIIFIYVIGRFFKMGHNNSKLTALAIAQGGEFAFVIFGIVAQLTLVSSEIISLVTVVIALSMALNPLLTLIDGKLSPLFQGSADPKYDDIENDGSEVMIAGFGRFGQTFGRILKAQDIGFVAIDHDPNQIELLRKFGNKVYYGDATRLDILEAAGAAKAKYFILAIDDVEMSLQAAQVVREHFPQIKIFARARNRSHVFDLIALGVHNIKREMFDSSANFVKDFLVDRGFTEQRASLIIERFKTHDKIMMQQQYKVRQDDKMYVSLSQQGAAQLAQVLSDDEMKSNIPTQSAPIEETIS